MNLVLDLDFEVYRLLKWKKTLERYYIPLMTKDQKLEVLANGVIEGWYGNEEIQRAILKNLYDEVNKKVISLKESK